MIYLYLMAYRMINYNSYDSDIVRYILLYKYGGFWFDLDILFSRHIDPMLASFGNHICV